MTKEIKVGSHHVEYCPISKEIYCYYNYERNEYIWLSKQDLIDMLALLEEEKTE